MEDHANLSRAAKSGQAGFGGLIGESAPMQCLYQLIGRVSQCASPVLLLGETGTGKELVARSIHYLGLRGQKPFVPVDCASLTPTLIESELFGHIKGAFTGAIQTKQGLFETANGGTLFLDEIGDLPADIQAKLLRATQEKEIRPVGSTGRNPVNVRLIAATSLDLEAAIRTGAFRQDLYFRLNVVQIKLPPLRERKSDIPLLASHFLEKFCDSQQPRKISKEAMQRLVGYDWPGNIRELENAIQCAVALSSDVILQVGDLPSKLHFVPAQDLCENNELLILEEMERRAIFRALKETRGDKLAAARLLGIGKTTVYRKLKEYARDSATPIDLGTLEVSHMEHLLICNNAKCRMIINLREKGQELHRSELILNRCPECDHKWSSNCPFCLWPLDVILRENQPHCAHCGQALQADFPKRFQSQ